VGPKALLDPLYSTTAALKRTKGGVNLFLTPAVGL
jgi:hypothetical protein